MFRAMRRENNKLSNREAVRILEQGKTEHSRGNFRERIPLYGTA